MSNTGSPLFRELARAADSNNVKDQLSVLFRREVAEDSKKMEDFYRLSNELTETVRIRDAYINELRIKDSSNEVAESIEIMRRMQLDDMQAASRLMLMAREMQDKVHEKTNFIVTLRLS
ncbi:hypothetical protein Tco_0031372 [Tanacetum coccineum]